MLIHGQNLFPLTKINARAVGYYMDSAGEVWSERARQGKLTKLAGTRTSSGRYVTLQTNGSFGQSYRLDQLQRAARQHKEYAMDVATVVSPVIVGKADLASVLGLRGQVAKAAAAAGLQMPVFGLPPGHDRINQSPPLVGKPAVPAVSERHHAATLDAGIKARGWVIACAENGALTFGSNPAIHTTIDSVNNELKRLAMLRPGTKFVKLRIDSALTIGAVWE